MAVISGVREQSEELILSDEDPPVYDLVNATGASRVVLVCEHAGRLVPQRLGDLGLPAAEFDRHIAWDIGAEQVARRISKTLDAPLLLQRYSRLVIDCNRPRDAPDAIPETSDTTRIPLNVGLTHLMRAARYAAIHEPFHDRLAALLNGRATAERTILVAIHSFTPMLLSEGRSRPWHVGLLYNRDDRFSRRLLAEMRALRPGLLAAFNKPYVVTDTGDYTIPVHAERRGLKHGLIEIRNDLIATPEGQADWATFLAAAIGAAERVDAQDDA